MVIQGGKMESLWGEGLLCLNSDPLAIQKDHLDLMLPLGAAGLRGNAPSAHCPFIVLDLTSGDKIVFFH